jgi:hypothetical protein
MYFVQSIVGCKTNINWRNAMQTPVYKAGTTLEQIIEDGYYRGFEATQTVVEAAASGFTVTLEQVQSCWKELVLVEEQEAADAEAYEADCANGLIRHADKYKHFNMSFDDFKGCN